MMLPIHLARIIHHVLKLAACRLASTPWWTIWAQPVGFATLRRRWGEPFPWGLPRFW